MASCVSDAPADFEEGATIKFAAGDMTRAVTTNINTEGSRFSLFGERGFKERVLLIIPLKYSTILPSPIVVRDGHMPNPSIGFPNMNILLSPSIRYPLSLNPAPMPLDT